MHLNPHAWEFKRAGADVLLLKNISLAIIGRYRIYMELVTFYYNPFFRQEN